LERQNLLSLNVKGMPTPDASQFTQLKKYSAINTGDKGQVQQKTITHLYQPVPSVTHPLDFLASFTNKYTPEKKFTQINHVTGLHFKPKTPGGNKHGFTPGILPTVLWNFSYDFNTPVLPPIPRTDVNRIEVTLLNYTAESTIILTNPKYNFTGSTVVSNLLSGVTVSVSKNTIVVTTSGAATSTTFTLELSSPLDTAFSSISQSGSIIPPASRTLVLPVTSLAGTSSGALDIANGPYGKMIVRFSDADTNTLYTTTFALGGGGNLTPATYTPVIGSYIQSVTITTNTVVVTTTNPVGGIPFGQVIEAEIDTNDTFNPTSYALTG